MISLFLGELYSFRRRKRILLVVLGIALAFFCNIVRSGILVWVAATEGTARVSQWHDPAGLGIFVFCLFALWGISLFLRKRETVDQTVPVATVTPAQCLSPVLLCSLGVLLLAGEIAIQSWYNSRASVITAERWSAALPQNAAGYAPLSIPTQTQHLLNADHSLAGQWTGADGKQWLLYSFQWEPGRTAALFVKVHRPDVCLPASGLTMLSETGVRFQQVNGVTLPLRSYRFDAHGVPLHVLYCYWDGRTVYKEKEQTNEEDWSARGRITAALLGRREIGAQMLELVVWGYEDDKEAQGALQEELRRIVRPG
jgi:exosortase/archaeosortase family protein